MFSLIKNAILLPFHILFYVIVYLSVTSPTTLLWLGLYFAVLVAVLLVCYRVK
jgi:hypothetical protein